MNYSNEKCKQIWKEKDGFTLIEMIITIAIISILTSLAAWGIHGWLSASYTARVSETAKTVFYAAQNYMLEKKQMGQLEEFHQSANAYGGDLSWDLLKQILAENNEGFDSAAYEEKYETDTTSYILMSKGSGEGNPLYQIIKEATNDDGLLENTFLLEYDHTTGVVRSVFYSEQTDDFSYLGAYNQRSNVILRNTEALHEKKQGYYGVDITGAKGVSEIYLEAPQDVALVNGERLYLQWNDINDENPEFDLEPSYLEELIYDITVSRKTETGMELLFSVEGARATNINGTNTLDEVDDLTTNYTGYRLAYNHTERTYQLLIDDIHHSLFTTYKLGVSTGTNVTVNADVAAEDTLICEVITRLDPDTTGIIAESLSGISNEQSSAYGGGDQELLLMDGGKLPLYGSGEKETGESKFLFSINKGRHFENLRYAVNTKEKSNFIQTDHIDFNKIEERPYNEDFVTILYTSPFRGSLKAEKDETNQYYSISNMKIKNLTTQPTGIFSQNMGEITGLTLDHIQVRGNVCVGVLAGANGGNLENITVTKSTVKGSHVLGGVTGYNTQSGEMTKVSSVAEVESDTKLLKKTTIEGVGDFPVESYGHYVGGIAGLNRGEAEQLTSGVLTGNVMSGSVTGTKFVGGVFGSSESEEKITLSELTNYQKIQLVSGLSNEDEAQCIGGILGFQGKGTLKGGANYGLLLLSTTNQAIKADQIVHIGGVVGLNQGAVENVTNYAGLHKDEKGSIDVKTLETNCINSVKKGSLPKYLGKYVGGIAGTNEDTGEIINCGNESGAVLGYSVVGGLVGNNLGKVRSNQVTREIGGLIIASDYLAGGVFGYNHGEKVEKYQNKANIFGKGMVGGIMGFHGKIGTGETEGIDQILAYLKAMGTKDTPQYYSKLLNIDEAMNVGAAQGIDDCINQGFVYGQDFYVGGISGLNYGDVTESNSKKIESNKFAGIYDKGGADCVGGIVGFNGKNSTLNGQKMQKQTVSVDIIGDDFVGGIAGINRGKVYGYYAVEGGIYGQGDCVGGVLGLNSDASALSEITNNKTSKITGEYFVGGIIGCNVAMTGSTNSEIKGVHSESGTIKGIAYVGGILGYNAYVDPTASLDGLFGDTGELRVLKANAFSPDRTSSQKPGTQMTVFKECTNSAIISGDRYVGGIIGYNSERAPLWIAKCTNKGTVSILNPEKTPSDAKGEKFYYIGGITGRNSAAGVIHGCANDGKVLSPSTYLGGICEVNEGYIQFCSTGNQNAEITGETNSVGGIVGLNENKAFIVSCLADQYAKIKGGNRTGGLVGTNAAGGVVTSNFLGTEAKDVTAIGESALSSGKDAMSFSDATVIGKDHTGGIVGHNSGSVEYIEVRNNAKITGVTNVGGFVGMNAKDASLGNKGSVISNLVNNAYVYGSNEVGGIVGRHDGTGITNCTNAGLVEATGEGQGTAGGITGTVTQGMYITDCTNYGLVRSNSSFAGGITGTNNGEIKNSNNYGSVEGSTMAISVTFVDEKANGSAIGGITGANFSNGNIINCASRNRRDDPLGNANNPFWNDAVENKIKGNYIVGGIIGHYARHQYAGGDFMNTSTFSKEVSITIETLPVEIGSTIRCYIGGVIGEYTSNPREETLEDFIFSGTINASGVGGNNQQNIGGIVASQPEKVILKNCLFSGKIIGNGNNGDDSGDTGNYSGIGGLAGRTSGKIILVPDANGVCYSNTLDSKVEGARRIGGIAGETQSQFQLLVDTGADVVELVDVNNGKTQDQFIYYENYATVAGGKAVGGFFGSMNSRVQTTLRYLKNKGQILTMNINGKTDVGGLVGQAWQADTLIKIEDCSNYAPIGTPNDLIVSNNVGGLIGSWTGATKKTLVNSSNEADATIYAGASNIGGLAGRMDSGEILSSCVNKANMSINTAKANVIVNGVGGIVGYAQDLTIAPNVMTQLNGVNTEIKIIGTATAIGGIVGISNNAVNIKYIENTRTITATDSVNNNKDLRAGGIVGRRNGGTLTISACKNSAKLWMPGANCVGGIVGNSTGGGTLDVSDTTNHAEIQGNGFVGGLFGDLAGGTNKITKISNHASIKGTTYVAGISGRIYNSTTTMTEAVNDAPIEGIVNSFGGGDVKFVGGCFGLVHDGTANLSQITNQETISSVKSGTNSISSVREVGGIAGSLQGNKVQLNNSINQGVVTVSAPPSGNTVEVGGLVGSMRKEASIGALDTETIRSTNEAAVQVDGVSKVGGIVGFLDTKALVFHAINKGNVTGTNSNEVGGVVGDAYGLVYSCQTSKEVKVSGNVSVGGLVGRAYNYTCKITSGAKGPDSSVNPGYDLSVTHADVEGNERVGGLVGHQQEATIYNLYVSNEVEVTLRSKDLGKKYAAGGIVGYAGSVNTTKGILANCFSGATVKMASGNPIIDTTIPYIGGIIGYRERRNNEAVTSIVDCYMTAPGQVDNTLPSSEKGGTVVASPWAVGNEPLETLAGGTTYIYSGSQDIQAHTTSAPVDPLLTAKKFEWCEDSYNALCAALGVTIGDWTKPEAILGIMGKYDGVKLSAPEMNPVRSGKVFNYIFPVLPIAGFYTEYGIKIYDGTYPLGTAMGSTDTPIFEVNKKIEIGDKIQDISIKFEEKFSAAELAQLVGKTLSVATYVKGYKLEDVGGYTKDSDIVVRQQFVIMPPLPQPKVVAVEPGPLDTDWFDPVTGKQTKIELEITNWSEYEVIAKEVYEELKNHSDKWVEANLFDQFINGVISFKMNDSYNVKKGDGMGTTQEIHTIKPKATATSGAPYFEVDPITNKAYIVIDYEYSSIFDANSDTRPWHAFNITALQGHAITINPLDATFKYHYLDSKSYTGVDYRLKNQLKIPDNLEGIFTGGSDIVADPLSPRYSLRWNLGGNVESDVAGWEVHLQKLIVKDPTGTPAEVSYDLKGADGVNPYIITVDGAKTTKLDLSKQMLQNIFNQCGIDTSTSPWWSHEEKYILCFSVKTLSKDPNQYMHSVVSPTKEVELVKQEKSITDVAVTADNNNRMKITWTDPAFDSSQLTNNGYIIDYKIELLGQLIQSGKNKISQVCEWKEIILDPKLADTSYTVTISITRVGIPGRSLNSDVYTAERIIGTKLQKPDHVKTEGIKTISNPDGTKSLLLNISWDRLEAPLQGEVAITNDNCKGYQVEVNTKENGTPSIVTVKGWDTKSKQILVPMDGITKVEVSLKALSANSKTTDSDWVKNTHLTIGSILSTPKITSVKLNGTTFITVPTDPIPPDAVVPIPAYMRKDYMKLSLGYEIVATGSIGQEITVLQVGQPNPLVVQNTTTEAGVAEVEILFPAEINLLSLAGKQLNIEMSNMSGNITAQLPSEVGTWVCTMPRIHLVRPEEPILSNQTITHSVLGGTQYTMYTVTGTVYDTEYLTSEVASGITEVEIKEEEALVRVGQTYQLLHKTTVGGKATYEPVEFVVLGDDGKPLKDTEGNMIKVKEYTVDNATENYEFYFTPDVPIDPAKAAEYEISVVNKAKVDSANIRFTNSKETKIAIQVPTVSENSSKTVSQNSGG